MSNGQDTAQPTVPGQQTPGEALLVSTDRCIRAAEEAREIGRMIDAYLSSVEMQLRGTRLELPTIVIENCHLQTIRLNVTQGTDGKLVIQVGHRAAAPMTAELAVGQTHEIGGQQP